MIDDPSRLPSAPASLPFPSPADGYVRDMDPRALAEVVVNLGGGRRRLEDAIDFGAGIRIHRAVGERVAKGEPILTLLGRDDATLRGELEERVRSAVQVGSPAPALPPLVHSLVREGNVVPWSAASPPVFGQG